MKSTYLAAKYTLVIFLLLVVFWISIQTGGISLSLAALLKGLFLESSRDVQIIWNLRFPRVFAAILGGMLLSVAGVLLQAVLRNPLADPGIMGVTSGAAFAAALLTAVFPSFAYLTPMFAFLGGSLAFLLVYSFAALMPSGPATLILLGMAVNAFFTGLYQLFQALSGSSYGGASALLSASTNLQTWSNVRVLLIACSMLTLFCCLFAQRIDLLTLSDKLIHSLGLPIRSYRFITALCGVLAASAFTALIGNVSFLGLIVPHMARLCVGPRHRHLLPFSALLGALVFLTADTLGRMLAYPYEIDPSILMAIAGGPAFIFLLRKNYGHHRK